MEKNLYKILELNNNATDEQIKRNYKKLALQYHPDRNPGNKEAEEKFKEIAFAYSILSDHDKRQKYDQFGITDDQQMSGGGFDASEIFKHFMNGFGGMFGGDSAFEQFFNMGSNGRRSAYQNTKGQSIRMQIPVTIQEVMDGVHKDIKYDIDVRCDKCNGTGGDGVETCPYCHGSGMISETQNFGFQTVKTMHPCAHCKGTGKTIKHKCSECNGTGFKHKEVSVRIDIPGGFDDGYQTLLRGKGYEAKYSGHENGDLLLEFIYRFDTSKYAVKDNTIYEFINVPYYDCILGKDYEHTLPNGDKVKVKIPEYTQDRTIVDTGKRYGVNKYCLFVIVQMPTYLREKEKELLRQIKNENS